MNPQQIKTWLDNNHVLNYDIVNFNNDLFVNIFGNLNLPYLDLEYLPFKFNVIKGDFFCNHNKLKSFNNFPEIIEGNLYCYNNYFYNFNEIPKIILGNLDCSFNSITNIEDLNKIKLGGLFIHNHHKYIPALSELYEINLLYRPNYLRLTTTQKKIITHLNNPIHSTKIRQSRMNFR